MLKQLRPLLEIAKKDKDIVAVLLFGSAARGEKYRDIDVALVLYPRKRSSLEMSNKRLKYLSLSRRDEIDVQIFQQLPPYIQERVLKEGKAIMCKDEDALYDVVFEAIRKIGDFMPHYRMFLEAEA